MPVLSEPKELYLHSPSLMKSLIFANCTFISIRTYFLPGFSICNFFFIDTDLMAPTLRFLATGSHERQLKWATKEKDCCIQGVGGHESPDNGLPHPVPAGQLVLPPIISSAGWRSAENFHSASSWWEKLREKEMPTVHILWSQTLNQVLPF